MLFFKKTEKEKGKTHILMETFYLVFFLWLQDVGEKLLSSSPECNPSLSSLRFVFSPHALPLIMWGGGVCVCVLGNIGNLFLQSAKATFFCAKKSKSQI